MINLFIAHEAQRWRIKSTETAIEAAVNGADALACMGLGKRRDAIRSSVLCLVNASLSVLAARMARGLEALAATQDEPETVRSPAVWLHCGTWWSAGHRCLACGSSGVDRGRRAEDVN